MSNIRHRAALILYRLPTHNLLYIYQGGVVLLCGLLRISVAL